MKTSHTANTMCQEHTKAKRSFLIISWALYDLANQFFAINVVSVYFVRWVTLEKNLPEIFYSLFYGISMLFVALLAPLLGTLSDLRGKHKPFLIWFTLIACIFTMLLSFTQSVFLGFVFFAIANFGCHEAVVFYNALLPTISTRSQIGFVSGLGKMFGYTGAVLALYLAKPVIAARGYQAVFLPTGLLFLLFALPCMIFIKERSVQTSISLVAFFKEKRTPEIFSRLYKTVFTEDPSKTLLNFLLANLMVLCAAHAIILFMAVYAGKVFDLTENQIIDLIAFSTLFAIGGSIFAGFISDYVGYRRSLTGVFVLWGITLLAGGLLRPPFHLAVGILGGISLGSIWVVSRAMVVKLVPEEKIGEAFGLFNLVSYLAGIVGPLVWGLLVLVLSPWGIWGYRIVPLSFIPFVVAGLVFLARVPEKGVHSH